MTLTTLVNYVLEEGDRVWIRKEEGEVEEGRYDDHEVIEEKGIKIKLRNGDSYRVTDYLMDSDEFNIRPDDEGMLSILDDYGFYGEKVPAKLEEASYAGEILGEKVEGYQEELNKRKASATD